MNRNTEMNISFSTNLKRILKSKRRTAGMMSRDMNVSRATIYNWLNGSRYPRTDMIERIAEYLNCSVDDLITDKSETSRSIQIPVFASVAAGIPMDAIEDIIDYEEIPPDWTGEYYALKIKGDSMSPRIANGDVVIVRQQETIESGQVGIVLINGYEATCKIVNISDNGITLVGFNPNFEPLHYSPADIMSLPVKIIGRVVECRQKY